MLDIKNLFARVEGFEQDILQGLSLNIKKGEVHAIMGPNGSGKSTLAKAVVGHPGYTVTSGDILFEEESILELEPEERALRGIFLSFQYPTEIPGVNNAEFLRMAYNAKQRYLEKEELDVFDFDDLLNQKMKLLEMGEVFKERGLNTGFSGGEKKRNEILQLLTLDPKLAFLDETDSGLDIDALRIVSQGINHFRGEEKAVILVTHYQRLLNYVEPDFVHILSNGKLVKTGGKELALELEEKGYEAVAGL